MSEIERVSFNEGLQRAPIHPENKPWYSKHKRRGKKKGWFVMKNVYGRWGGILRERIETDPLTRDQAIAMVKLLESCNE